MRVKKKIAFYCQYIVICLVALSSIQCLDRCKQADPEEHINLNFLWENDPCPLNIADGLDIYTPVGFVCHVPSEKATYFLDENKPCWKFTQGDDRTLIGEKVADFPKEFFRHNSFSFFAGSREQQNLFFGEIYSLGGQNHLVIAKLETNTWKEKAILNLNQAFPNYQFETDQFVTGCTMEKDGQYQGCIIFLIRSRADLTKYELACLTFNPSTNTIEKVTVNPEYNERMQEYFLQASVGLSSSKILLLKGKLASTDLYDMLGIEENELKPLRTAIGSSLTVQAANNKTIYRPVWDAFSVLIAPKLSIWMPIFTICHNGTRKFFHMSESYQFKQLPGLPSSASALQGKNTLVIPFSDCVYVISSVLDSNQNEKPIAYRAKLGVLNSSK